jgi:hypothetical protein
MYFAVTVREISTFVYHVEADSAEEADKIARERRECSYDDGEEGLEEIGVDIDSTEVRELDEDEIEEMDA